MASKSRYRCKYCGVDEVHTTMSQWQLKALRCKKCNHDKFIEKRLTGKENVYGYDEEEDDKPYNLDWGID